MDSWAVWLLLVIALAIGWGLGYRARLVASKADSSASEDPAVKHRLQLLFDSYSDDALDRFIHSLEVNPETLALHISIGRHFRTEGEVEKAILVHQNLMSHPELPKIQLDPVIYELAKDYKVAGLFDRAESLLKQLVSSKTFGFKSKKLLLDIYELEKDWDEALETGQAIDLKRHPDIRKRVAQYWCEMSQRKRQSGEMLEAKRLLDKALSADKTCVRAHLDSASMLVTQERYRDAILQLKTLLEYAPEFFVLAQPLLLKCTEETGSFERYCAYLKALYQQTGQVNIILALVDAYARQGRIPEADEYLEQEARVQPSLTLLEALLDARRAQSALPSDAVWQALSEVIEKIRSERPAYCCANCGFTGKQLHWMCPSCKSWETVRPFIEHNAPA